MLISSTTTKAFGLSLAGLSYVNLIPFDFDFLSLLLKQPKKKSALRWSKFHRNCMFLGSFYVILRMCLRLKDLQSINLVFFAHTVVAISALVLASICMWEMHSKSHDVMHFANSVFKALKQTKYSNGEDTSELDNSFAITLAVWFSLGLMIVNPTIHSQGVYNHPCIINFTSSLFLTACWQGGDPSSITFLQKIPFVMWEYYITTLTFSSFFFYWSILYFGMAWIILELEMITERLESKLLKDSMTRRYRFVQCLTILMNQAFKVYLATFSTLLLMLVALLVCGMIRYWAYLKSNIMYPFCVARCGFEAFSLIKSAGRINDADDGFIGTVKRQIGTFKMKGSAAAKPGNNLKYDSSWIRSANWVRCRAGSFYIFETSIFLSSINSTIDLMTNVLLTFPE